MTIIGRRTRLASAATLALAGALLAAAPSEAANLTPYIKKHYHPAPGAIAAGVAGGVVLGALAAGAAGTRYVEDTYMGACYTVRRRYIDEDGYPVVRRIRVCE